MLNTHRRKIEALFEPENYARLDAAADPAYLDLKGGYGEDGVRVPPPTFGLWRDREGVESFELRVAGCEWREERGELRVARAQVRTSFTDSVQDMVNDFGL